MTLWGLGNIILVVVVVPVLVALLSRVLGALERIRGAADDALAGGVALIGELDTTPDLRQQALRHGIATVDAILFTHNHADHVLGLDETRRFSVLDDRGRLPSDAEWTLDNAAVATLRTTPQIELAAVSAGEAVLTVRWRGLSAAAHVSVMGTAAPAGTTIWSHAPVQGSVERIVQGAVALDNERRVYALEHEEGVPQDLIRAFDDDGREVWAASVPGPVIQLSGDPFGGVVALHGDVITEIGRAHV